MRRRPRASLGVLSIAVLLLVEVLQAAILALGFVSIVHVPQNHLLRAGRMRPDEGAYGIHVLVHAHQQREMTAVTMSACDAASISKSAICR